MNRKQSAYVFAVGLGLCAFSYWSMERLPAPEDLRSELLLEPEQVESLRAPFDVDIGGVKYSVTPRYAYELYGLVVSRHDAKAFADLVHAQWKDSLNVVDFCVIWGRNAKTNAYQGLTYSSDAFTCNYKTSSRESFRLFDEDSISNNHILTDSSRVARLLRSVRIGDQIHLTGQLVDYQHHQGFDFSRGTSTVRTDRGNGACETIFVDYMEIIQTNSQVGLALWWLSIAVMCTSVLLWWRAPIKIQ
jgi:hypothetical protein